MKDVNEERQKLFKLAQFCRDKLNQLDEEYEHFRRFGELVSKELERLDEN